MVSPTGKLPMAKGKVAEFAFAFITFANRRVASPVVGALEGLRAGAAGEALDERAGRRTPRAP